MNPNDVNERDFHKGEGHKIPLVIKVVWTVFFVVAIVYLYKNIFSH